LLFPRGLGLLFLPRNVERSDGYIGLSRLDPAIAGLSDGELVSLLRLIL
jgi:hypothetical protein